MANVEVIDLLSDNSDSSCNEAKSSGDTIISISSGSSCSRFSAGARNESRSDHASGACRPKRRRNPPARLIDTINNEPMRKRRRAQTQCYDVEKASAITNNYNRRKRPQQLLNSIHKARTTMLSYRCCDAKSKRKESEFIADNRHLNNWWKCACMTTSIPENVMITTSEDDNKSVASSVTLEPFDSDSDAEISSISNSSVECRVCERHSLHLGQIGQMEGLLENVKSMNHCDDGKFAEFIRKVQLLLQSLEMDADMGISVFYHEHDMFNPSFTITKLIMICDGLYKICTIATQFPSRWKDVIEKLFKKSGECGVIIRIMHLASHELMVSRVKVPYEQHDVDHLLGVSFGLQMIKTMMSNIYLDSRLKLADTAHASIFLDHPLEAFKRCIKRNCVLDNRGVTICQCCGLRYHKSCFSNEIDVFEKTCAACKNASSLVNACAESNLKDIYTLLVAKGASPLQPTALPGSPHIQTALHAAVSCNNYNLLSMLLYGAYVLLNCDKSLREWSFPSIAWGRCSSNLNPFDKGIDICTKDMNAKPPTEILLLLCSRGYSNQSSTKKEICDALSKRHRMIQVLRGMSESDLLQSDISNGVESLPVRMSECTFPNTNFLYVSKSVESRQTAIRWWKKPLSSFEGDCTREKLQILHRDQGLPPSWNSHCNYLCSTSTNKKKCACQIKGTRFELEIFETNGRGLGLRTAKGQSIKKGDIICNYEGEIVTAAEAKTRDEEYAGNVGSYIINLDEKGEICIDATQMRSASAFINHSCAESNTQLTRALSDHLDDRFPMLVFRAKQDIGELQELTFNYVKGMPDGEKPTGFCSQCSREHCLCRQCTEIEHKKHV